jgi:hypothetical protein
MNGTQNYVLSVFLNDNSVKQSRFLNTVLCNAT